MSRNATTAVRAIAVPMRAALYLSPSLRGGSSATASAAPEPSCKLLRVQAVHDGRENPVAQCHADDRPTRERKEDIDHSQRERDTDSKDKGNCQLTLHESPVLREGMHEVRNAHTTGEWTRCGYGAGCGPPAIVSSMTRLSSGLFFALDERQDAVGGP